MSVPGKEGSMEPCSIRFRAQFGDVGPFTFQKTELSLENLSERAYESWPKEDESSASVPLCKEDIKFIRNGRVLASADDLRHACQDYFSLNHQEEEDRVLILHAVVRPPKPPVKKKGKKKLEPGRSSESETNTLGSVDCSCCVIV